ncbi:hypothetical protein F4560_008717 [Saccharothrix ecbatanensis]|uniref:Uncharacterized protein n=1 Tax=Saccharothrix ecbatanensis TaxID=1105145 RepID=A0A7W9M6H5_9PSEU|nr:DUF3970 family protein [Saccharothrix ecbatanensis]MBB5808949.1 hypothetical protein [Saccharothrix ecbatanensis]
MKIRVEGTADEVDSAVQSLRQVFEVQEVSRFYANRGTSALGRVYVTVAPLREQPPVQPPAVRIDKPGRPVRRRTPRAELENEFIDLDHMDEGKS